MSRFNPAATKKAKAKARVQQMVQTIDWSNRLKDSSIYSFAPLAKLGLGGELTAFAVDPLQGLLAVGTHNGKLAIFGSDEVATQWDIGLPARIKHLQFHAGHGKLLCLDSKDTLYIFNLAKLDKHNAPSRQFVGAMHSGVSIIELSSLHQHVFMGSHDGSVEVFSMIQGIVQPKARIPNLWLAQEEVLRRSGVVDAPSRRHIPACTDIKIHPWDMNLLLIGYEGGVALWNISERRTMQTWEFVLPPGAPGGGNAGPDRIFTERRLVVTCLAWRPDGIMFAVGHEDGCMSFVHYGDEMPIAIRTLERADVNRVTEDDLFAAHPQAVQREPIFRLMWSGYDTTTTGTGNKATTLTVLGGGLPSDPPGVHVLHFPEYTAPWGGSGTATQTGNISSELRLALKNSVTPYQHSLYPTQSPPEDFILLPRNTPHYGLAYDPVAIIISTSTDHSLPAQPAPHADRGIEAWSFPPAGQISALRVPAQLSFCGAGTVVKSFAYTLPSLSYQRLTKRVYRADPNRPDPNPKLPLRGGSAEPRLRRNASNDPASEGSCRIFVTLHADLTIKFWDISSSLLGGGMPTPAGPPELSREFPLPLPHLTIDMRYMLLDPSCAGLAAGRLLRERPWELEFSAFALALDSIEASIVLSTGELFVLRFGRAHLSDVDEISAPFAALRLHDKKHMPSHNKRDTGIGRYTNITRAPTQATHSHGDAFRALAAFQVGPVGSFVESFAYGVGVGVGVGGGDNTASAAAKHKGLNIPFNKNAPQDAYKPGGSSFPSAVVAPSDIGFVAAAVGTSLVVASLAGPDLLVSETAIDISPVTALAFCVTALEDDPEANLRLIVSLASGAVKVLQFSFLADHWMAVQDVCAFRHDHLERTITSWVLDSQARLLDAKPNTIQAARAAQNGSYAYSYEGLSSLWVVVARRGIACYANVSGPRVTGAELDPGDEAISGQLINRHGYCALAVATRSRFLLVYSLPGLDLVQRVTLGLAAHVEPGDVWFTADGDVVHALDPLNIRLGTLFDTGRGGYPPMLSLYNPSIPIPAAVNALYTAATAVGSLFGTGTKVYTGPEIDYVLSDGVLTPPKKSNVSSTQVLKDARARANGGSARTAKGYGYGDMSQVTGLFERAQEALNQRGDALDIVSDNLKYMTDGVVQFAKDTKKTATKEATKKVVSGAARGIFKF